jgi:hypothetical protein
MNTTMVKHTTYASTDDPAILIALLRDAIVARQPVILTWIQGSEEQAADVQPTAIDPVALRTKVRTEMGQTIPVDLWNVAACETVDGESWWAA